MRALRNILTGIYYMTICLCCGEPYGARCDYYCKDSDPCFCDWINP